MALTSDNDAWWPANLCVNSLRSSPLIGSFWPLEPLAVIWCLPSLLPLLDTSLGSLAMLTSASPLSALSSCPQHPSTIQGREGLVWPDAASFVLIATRKRWTAIAALLIYTLTSCHYITLRKKDHFLSNSYVNWQKIYTHGLDYGLMFGCFLCILT